MHIVCLHSPLAPVLAAQGHTVTNWNLPAGIVNLPALLARNNIRHPDLFIQHEHLGKRVFLDGLSTLPCPTVFVAVDSHINMYWQHHYARLFDITATPHVSLFQALPPEWRPRDLRRFTHIGHPYAWREHAGRKHFLGLCARVDQHRIIRLQMSKLLQKYCGIQLYSDLSFAEMLDFYADTRVIPNEAIAYEVNFRLFEGASCGSLVLSPDCGEDQNAVFEPGKEFILYRDGLELLELVRYYQKHPAVAEGIGKAAWKRVRQEHLPEQRAPHVAEWLKASRNRAEGHKAVLHTWLTRYQLARQGIYLADVQDLLCNCDALLKETSLAESDKAMLECAWLQMATESLHSQSKLHSSAHTNSQESILARCHNILVQNLYVQDLDYNFCASAVALRLQNFTLAMQFWVRFVQNRHTTADIKGILPKSPYKLWLAWAKILQQAKRIHQTGFAFNAGANIPSCAYECLLEAQRAATGEEIEWATQLAELYLSMPGHTVYMHSLLAELSLKNPTNWRMQMKYGLQNLRVCLVDEGLFEIEEARKKAEDNGKMKLFNSMLSSAPSAVYLRTLLDAKPYNA